MRICSRWTLPLALVTTGCTSLGPMPATTGISASPASRPDVSLQAGWAPGYRLSAATQEKPAGAAIQQLAALVEPDSWLGLPGAVVGLRGVIGNSGDSYAEPMLGYRTHVDRGRHVSILGAGSAARASHSAKGASYEATRASGELMRDVNPHAEGGVELHLLGGVSAMALSARGTYCVDQARRYGVDCDVGTTPSPRVSGEVGGVFPALTGGVAVDLARRGTGPFHGVRIGAHVAHGQMPSIVGGVEGDRRAYTSGGLLVTVGGGPP